jgi:post-segregation antitoxin (ccd killing protein)
MLNIMVDEDDVQKAKNLGINMSQVCRRAVHESVVKMEGNLIQ